MPRTENSRAFYVRMKAERKCPRCCANLSDDWANVACPRCSDQSKNYSRDRYRTLKSLGLCASCKTPTESSLTYCHNCK